MNKNENQIKFTEFKNSPIDPLESVGKFYEGLGRKKRKRSFFMRIIFIIFFITCFLLPGLFLIFASFVGYAEMGIMEMLMPLIIGTALFLAGIGGIRTNLKT